jgi:hypothetical protein
MLERKIKIVLWSCATDCFAMGYSDNEHGSET